MRPDEVLVKLSHLDGQQESIDKCEERGIGTGFTSSAVAWGKYLAKGWHGNQNLNG